jgi:excisionase family DNA binding protein
LQTDHPSIDFIPAYVYNITMNDVYSVNEAAEKLNLDPSQIRRLLAKGTIRGKKLGRDWVVLDLNYTRKRKPKGGKK